jgi:hypothetical protein
MSNIDLLKQELVSLDRRSPDFVLAFDELIEQYDCLGHPEIISLLLSYLPEGDDNDDVLFSILHVIESFDDTIYIYKILENIHFLANNRLYSAVVIHVRIVNSEQTFAVYRKAAANISESQKKSVRVVLKELLKRSTRFSDKVKLVEDIL